MPQPASSDSLTPLYAAWRRLGVMFTVRAALDPIDVERLILASATQARADGRLTVCVASWLAVFHDFVDGRRLSELTRRADATTRAYLGALLTLAVEAPDGAGRAPQFEAALAHCRPIRPARPFFDVPEGFTVQHDWMRAHGLPLFRHWGFWHDDATLKRGSLRPLEQILTVPELRARALCGPSIEAACIASAQNRVTNARQLAREFGATYAATHAAVERLVGRGLLQRERNGVRQELRLSRLARAALAPMDDGVARAVSEANPKPRPAVRKARRPG